MPVGIDISEHQRGFDDFDPYDFAILRARNEWGRTDYQFWNFWNRAAGRTLRGVYIWPLAGAGTAVNFEAGRTAVLEFPGSEFGYWIDQERSGRGLASPEEVEAMARGIQEAGGQAGVYSNIPELPRTPHVDTLPWWMAHYGRNDGNRNPLVRPSPPGDRPWAIHQFTSAGGLDVNFAPSLDIFGPVHSEPRVTIKKGADLYVAIIIGYDGLPYAYLVSGSVILGEFPAEPRGFLMIPQAALDFAGDTMLVKNLSELPAAPGALVKASAHASAPVHEEPPVSDPTPPPATGDLDDVHRDIAALYLANDNIADALEKVGRILIGEA